jgi:hypothetical protein
MSDAQFGQRVACLLDEGLARVDTDTRTRLQVARKAALSRADYRPRGRLAWALAWAGADGLRPGWLAGTRLWVATSLLLAVVAFGGYSAWSVRSPGGDAFELDLSILSDDLPVTAYIEEGFDAWLKRPADAQP